MENILKGFTLYINQDNFIGDIEELTPPKLTLKTEEFRNGGMDMPVDVDMGMEKMEASFSLTNYSDAVLKLFGVTPNGQSPVTYLFRGSLKMSNNTTKKVVITMNGLLRETDSGSWKSGDKSTLKGTLSVTYYKHEIGGNVIHEIDAVNMKRIINGVDQLESMRKDLGMT